MKSNRLLNRACNPSGLGALAAVQLPGGNATLCRRGVVRWFETARVVFVLMGALVACVGLSPSLHAGIIFNLNPGDATVYPGGTLSIPITLSATPDLSGKNWLNAGLTLTWNSSVLVLQPTSITLNGSLPWTLANFNSPSPGELVFSWSFNTPPGAQVPDGTTLFTVNFQAVGDWANYGNSTTLGTSADPILFSDFTSANPSFASGLVTIIPEPINWALGLFASVCLVVVVGRSCRVRDRIHRWRAVAVRWVDAV